MDRRQRERALGQGPLERRDMGIPRTAAGTVDWVVLWVCGGSVGRELGLRGVVLALVRVVMVVSSVAAVVGVVVVMVVLGTTTEETARLGRRLWRGLELRTVHHIVHLIHSERRSEWLHRAPTTGMHKSGGGEEGIEEENEGKRRRSDCSRDSGDRR